MEPSQLPYRDDNRNSRPAQRPGRQELITVVALTSLLWGGLFSLTGCKGQKFDIGPSGGEVAGVIIGAAVVVGGTTAVLIHANHSHHQVKGCVSSGPGGLEVETEDKKIWLLTGNTPTIKAGDVLRLHGTKIKRPKNSSGNPSFEVQTISKDYGPCKVVAKSQAGLSNPDPVVAAE